MRCHVVRTTLFITVLMLMATGARADEGRNGCSLRGVAGEWGYTFSGTLFPEGVPGGEIFAGTGKYTSDAQGNVASTQTISSGGRVANDVTEGSITVNRDCTAKITIDVYDEDDNLLRTSSWDIVFVDNQGEVFGVMTSLELADGTIVPSVATMLAKRTLPSQRRVQ